MVSLRLFLLLGSAWMCSAYVSDGSCPNPPKTGHSFNLLTKKTYYTIATGGSGLSNYFEKYKPQGPIDTLQTYLFTRDSEDFCFLTSTGSLTKTDGFLIEIGTPVIDNFELIISYSQCNQSVMKKTRVWFDPEMMIFWSCYEPKNNRNSQHLIIFLESYWKERFTSSKIRVINNYQRVLRGRALQYVSKELINQTEFDWQHIVPSMRKEMTALKSNLGNTKIIVISLIVAIFGITFVMVIYKMN